LSFAVVLRAGLATLGLALAAGCTSSPGRSPMNRLVPGAEDAAIKRAVAKDSFPTARQAGIASKPPSD